MVKNSVLHDFGFGKVSPANRRGELWAIEASYKKGQIFHVESYNVLLFGQVKIKMHVPYIEWSLAMILTNINLQKDEVFTKFLRIRAFYKVSLTAL